MCIQRGRSSVKRKQNQTKRSSKGGVPPTAPCRRPHRLRLRLRLPHPGRARDHPSRSAPGESNQGSPPNPHWGPCRRHRRRPHRSSSRGVWLVPRGDGVPDPAFCLDFAFPVGLGCWCSCPGGGGHGFGVGQRGAGRDRRTDRRYPPSIAVSSNNSTCCDFGCL